MDPRRQRLERARLYLISDGQSDDFLRAVLCAGVDVVQIRMKDAGDEEILDTGRRYRRVCSDHGALLIVNDRPDLVGPIQADGVHVGQDDMPVHEARELVGDERLVGVSTHSPDQIASARGCDYIGVGPVFETPTKPGRPAVGLDLVGYAAAHAAMPFFAIGGISAGNVATVRDAGAQRVAVLRALTEARDPAGAAQTLAAALTADMAREVGVGST